MQADRVEYYRRQWKQGHLLFQYPMEGDWTPEERGRHNQATPPAQLWQLVVEQTGCGVMRAKQALTAHDSDVVLAIIDVEMSLR